MGKKQQCDCQWGKESWASCNPVEGPCWRVASPALRDVGILVEGMHFPAEHTVCAWTVRSPRKCVALSWAHWESLGSDHRRTLEVLRVTPGGTVVGESRQPAPSKLPSHTHISTSQRFTQRCLAWWLWSIIPLISKERLIEPLSGTMHSTKG